MEAISTALLNPKEEFEDLEAGGAVPTKKTQLSQEQLDRIRDSREKALALKRKREAEVATESGGGEVGPRCEVCQSTELLDQQRLEAFAVSVCKKCVDKMDDYDLMSKADASSQYLLPDDTLNFLPHKEKSNPHNKTWAPMKQFLRKQVRDQSYERWKDEEGLRAEKTRRDKLKYERDLAKAQAVALAAGQGAGISSASNSFSVDEPGSETSLILSKMLAGADDDKQMTTAHAPVPEELQGTKAEGMSSLGLGLPKSKKSKGRSNKTGLAGMLKCIVGSD